MIRGLYTSATGMQQDAQRLEVIANNLANANTAGYQRDTVVSQPFHDMLIQRINGSAPAPLQAAPTIGRLGLGAFTVMTATRLKDGSLRETGRELDVALLGSAFFSVRTPNGVMYTRNGSFTQDAAGRLVTADGHPVLVNGAPVGAPGARLRINEQGQVLVNDQLAGQLDIVTADQLGPLRKVGHNLYSADGQGSHVMAAPPDPQDPRGAYQLRVGFLENANVEPVLEMVELLAAMRSFESNQKAVQVQDETLAKVINEAGRI